MQIIRINLIKERSLPTDQQASNKEYTENLRFYNFMPIFIVLS